MHSLRMRARLQLLSERMGRSFCDGVRSSQSWICHHETWRGDNYPVEKRVMTRSCHSFTVHPTQRKQRKKILFSSCFLQERINSSMKQIPLFLPGTVRSWAPKVLQYKGLSWNTAPWYTHAHTLLIFFLLRLVLLSLPVFGQRLDALSAALLSNETVREREGERTKAHEWETELEGGGRECARERSAQVKQSKQNGMRRECVVCTCVRVCLGVEVCRNGDADTNPHWKHIAAVSDGDELACIMEGRAN